MLHYALILLTVALVVALLGLGGLASAAFGLAGLLALIGLGLAALGLMAPLLRAR
jgi:uncharacterized membrane protein YtjA (UPF0391 family)